jgi:hypothetical protein
MIGEKSLTRLIGKNQDAPVERAVEFFRMAFRPTTNSSSAALKQAPVRRAPDGADAVAQRRLAWVIQGSQARRWCRIQKIFHKKAKMCHICETQGRSV